MYDSSVSEWGESLVPPRPGFGRGLPAHRIALRALLLGSLGGLLGGIAARLPFLLWTLTSEAGRSLTAAVARTGLALVVLYTVACGLLMLLEELVRSRDIGLRLAGLLLWVLPATLLGSWAYHWGIQLSLTGNLSPWTALASARLELTITPGTAIVLSIVPVLPLLAVGFARTLEAASALQPVVGLIAGVIVGVLAVLMGDRPNTVGFGIALAGLLTPLGILLGEACERRLLATHRDHLR